MHAQIRTRNLRVLVGLGPLPGQSAFANLLGTWAVPAIRLVVGGNRCVQSSGQLGLGAASPQNLFQATGSPFLP